MKPLFTLLFILAGYCGFSQQCTYAGQTYSEGAVVCMNNKQYQCYNGSWEYLGIDCGTKIEKKVTAKSTKQSETRIVRYSDADSVAVLPCISFFSTGNPSQVGMINNCSDCKIVIVNWAGIGLREYRLNGYQSTVIPLLSYHGQMVGERPCN